MLYSVELMRGPEECQKMYRETDRHPHMEQLV